MESLQHARQIVTRKNSLPAVDAAALPAVSGSGYPAPFRSRVAARRKQRLGDAFGLGNFGVNLTTLPAGTQSALRHWHSHEDEFIYLVSGELVLVTDAGEQRLVAGMCAGFPAGRADGHCLINRGDRDAVYFEVGDRHEEDKVIYPDDDMTGQATPQGRRFNHKDGTPY